MSIHSSKLSRFILPLTASLAALAPTLIAHEASAAPLVVVTPGEQNTQSGENGCAALPCNGGHWLHYPELIQTALGAAMYTVQNNGDGGAVLGCDATTVDIAGGDSFCKSSKFTDTMKTPPNIAIIGPFGEHDQRIVGKSAGNTTTLYSLDVFEKAYEGLVQKYLAVNAKVYMMTPIDVPWGGTPDLPAGDNLVKNIMLPAAIKVAGDHQITVIDTYTAIPSAMYYGTDGQVTMAGQQKMADLIVAALQAPATGGTGGTGSGGAAGMAGAAGAAVGGGGAGGAPAATGGVAGSAAGGVGTAGTATAAGGVSTGGAAVGAGGTSATGGTGGASTTTPVTTPTSSSSNSSGCALSAPSGSGWGGGVALLVLGASLLVRKRRAS